MDKDLFFIFFTALVVCFALYAAFCDSKGV